MGMKKINKKGYTLIEMLVVLVIISLTLPLIFTILSVILQQQLKIYRLIEVKKQGDFVMGFMKNKIATEALRISSQANPVLERCTLTSPSYSAPGGTNFYLLNAANQPFRFIISGNQLMVNTVSTNTTSTLTTNSVIIRNLQFSCVKRSTLAVPLVQISFDIEYNNGTSAPDAAETAQLTYATKVRLRSP